VDSARVNRQFFLIYKNQFFYLSNNKASGIRSCVYPTLHVLFVCEFVVSIFFKWLFVLALQEKISTMCSKTIPYKYNADFWNSNTTVTVITRKMYYI